MAALQLGGCGGGGGGGGGSQNAPSPAPGTTSPPTAPPPAGSGGSGGATAPPATVFSFELNGIEARRVSNGESIPVDAVGVTSGDLTLQN